MISMMRKMLVFSLLTLLIGLNLHFLMQNILSLLFLGFSVPLSVFYFIYGILKDTKETRNTDPHKSAFSYLLPKKYSKKDYEKD